MQKYASRKSSPSMHVLLHVAEQWIVTWCFHFLPACIPAET